MDGYPPPVIPAPTNEDDHFVLPPHSPSRHPLSKRLLIAAVAVVILALAGILFVWQRRLGNFGIFSTPTPSATPTTRPTPALSSRTLIVELSGIANYVSSHYEAWVTFQDGSRESLGKFIVRTDGTLQNLRDEMITENRFLSSRSLSEARSFFLTVEPRGDEDPAPSSLVLLSGEFGGGVAPLTFPNFQLTSLRGSFLLATPTDGSNASDERSGIWLGELRGDEIVAGLTLPDLPSQWIYEGWIVHRGVTLSIGRFRHADTPDTAAPFSDTRASAPSLPGEDFLKNPPEGANLTFPVDLTDGTSRVFVTIEPDESGRDISGPGPFATTVFEAAILAQAEVRRAYPFTVTSGSIPSGRAVLELGRRSDVSPSIPSVP
ncbi:MAG: hypothetical protein HY459_04845 [Parcubacteria group bacterium]|nr:hypothetical protein [Parcubacteria group bacterium]